MDIIQDSFIRERLDYQPIIDRSPLPALDNTRLIVWPVVNVEYWDASRTMPRQALPAPTGQGFIPDVPNWSWHEYGMRVGFWRMKRLFDRYDIRPTLSINGYVCKAYPQVAQAARDASWEFMGHGYKQMPTHLLDDEGATIRDTIDEIRAFTGKAPIGWLGPGLTETADSLDLLSEAGIRYVGDWVVDDEPCQLKTKNGPMVAMPYTVELNDIPIMAVQHHSGPELWTRVRDTFECLYHESDERIKVMAIAVHPFLSGAPHRFKYLEKAISYLAGKTGVRFMTGEQIYHWYTS